MAREAPLGIPVCLSTRSLFAAVKPHAFGFKKGMMTFIHSFLPFPVAELLNLRHLIVKEDHFAASPLHHHVKAFLELIQRQRMCNQRLQINAVVL